MSAVSHLTCKQEMHHAMHVSSEPFDMQTRNAPRYACQQWAIWHVNKKCAVVKLLLDDLRHNDLKWNALLSGKKNALKRERVWGNFLVLITTTAWINLVLNQPDFIPEHVCPFSYELKLCILLLSAGLKLQEAFEHCKHSKLLCKTVPHFWNHIHKLPTASLSIKN